MRWLFIIIIILTLNITGNIRAIEISARAKNNMIDIQKTSERLQAHLRKLTVAIGERSVRFPNNLAKTADYIESFFHGLDLPVNRQTYNFHNITVANIISEISFSSDPSHFYVLGAHYDSVSGTVGADDNASAVAVLLETARNLRAVIDGGKLDVAVKFVAFALEEPPVFNTQYMGSRVYAEKARQEKQTIDGMICLEMVGYTCHEAGCQDYPFPLGFFDYPAEGNFIGIVGNVKSRGFSQSLFQAFQNNPQLPAVKLTVPFNGRIMPAIRLSDHASFWDKGYKAVMITDSAFYRNHHYHRPSDTMEKLDYGFMAELVESLMIFFCSQHRK